MVKQPPKMTALVVSAIRNLREVQGSTPREILNYIMSEYNASANPSSDPVIQRKLSTALKRGLEYGILKQVHGHYCLNTDPEAIAPMDEMMGPMERGCKGGMRRKRKRRARTRGRKGCKSRSRRRRKRGASGRKRRRGGKRSKCGSRRRKSRGRSRRARKSRGGRCRPKRSARRSRRAKSKCHRRGGEDIDMLAKDPVENRHRVENPTSDYTYERERDRSQSRTRHQSRSRSRSPSHSRSSGSSDREGNEGNRRSRQVE